MVLSSRKQWVHRTVKAPKGTESIRNNTEAKGCIFRSYSDMVSVNNISGFKIYIKGVRVLQQILQHWSQQKSKHKKEWLLESKCAHFFGGRGCFQSHLLIGKDYQLQDKKEIQKSEFLWVLPVAWFLYRSNY